MYHGDMSVITDTVCDHYLLRAGFKLSVITNTIYLVIHHPLHLSVKHELE